MNAPSTLVTLDGYLGKNREEHFTRTRTYTAQRWDDILEEFVEEERTTKPRPYLKLSLAVRERPGAPTNWHQLVVWNPRHRTAVQNLYLSRSGDHVTVQGYYTEFTFTNKDGNEVTGRHFVVESFKFLGLKCRTAPPRQPKPQAS